MTENVCSLFDNLTKHNSRDYGYELSKSEIVQILKLFDDVKELERYRAIGTVEDIEKSMKNLSVLLAEHELLKLYQSIGTIDEFKALKEKNVAKKPILSRLMMTKREFQICPACERLALYDGIKFDYCQYCGQKIDWSE